MLAEAQVPAQVALVSPTSLQLGCRVVEELLLLFPQVVDWACCVKVSVMRLGRLHSIFLHLVHPARYNLLFHGLFHLFRRVADSAVPSSGTLACGVKAWLTPHPGRTVFLPSFACLLRQAPSPTPSFPNALGACINPSMVHPKRATSAAAEVQFCLNAVATGKTRGCPYRV